MILSGEIKSTIGAAAPAVAITAITETTMIAAVKMLALSASGSKLAWFTNLVPADPSDSSARRGGKVRDSGYGNWVVYAA